VPTGPQVILALKIAVGAVTVLLLASLTAIALGKRRLHGRINVAFFVLTLTALIAFEGVVRLVNPDIFNYYDEPGNEQMRTWLRIHLCFSVPSAVLLPFMLFTGRRAYRTVHLALAAVFGVLWAGTFITGVFFLQ
jgi:uncharacterized membrane protein YozB (DUF420 family)